MTPTELRERLTAALRERHGAALHVEFLDCIGATRVKYNVPGTHVDTTVMGHESGLGVLATALGLNADGADPREENERLKRLLREAHVAVREFAPMCKGNECYGIAPREFCDENMNNVRVCDDDECARELGATVETEIYDVQHADAMRAARGS